MRRLRAVAAIVALAVIWLGYSVAREIAAGRPEHSAVELQAASDLGTLVTPGASGAGAPVPHQFPAVPNAQRPAPQIAGADVSSEAPRAIAAQAPVETPSAAASPDLAPLPTSPAHVPFLQAALHDARTGGGAGVHGLPNGAFGGVPSMSGFGGGSGLASSPVSDANGDASGSGDGRPSVLGHRFAAQSDESNGVGSNGFSGSNDQSSNDQNGAGNGNNGSNGANGSNDHNGDGNGNNGNDGNNGDNGKNGDAGSNGDNGSNGSSENGGQSGGDNGPNGGDGGDGDGGHGDPITGFVADVVDEGTSGGVRDVPEPGSILVGLGAVAALARRRAR